MEVVFGKVGDRLSDLERWRVCTGVRKTGGQRCAHAGRVVWHEPDSLPMQLRRCSLVSLSDTRQGTRPGENLLGAVLVSVRKSEQIS